MEKVRNEDNRWDIDDSPKTNEEQIAELEELIELLKGGCSAKERAQN